jgi:hypothetical protein
MSPAPASNWNEAKPQMAMMATQLPTELTPASKGPKPGTRNSRTAAP